MLFIESFLEFLVMSDSEVVQIEERKKILSHEFTGVHLFCDCLNKFGFYYLNLNLPYLFIFLVLSESSRCFFLDLTPILKAFYSLLKTKK